MSLPVTRSARREQPAPDPGWARRHALGQRVAEARRDAGLTQRELAERLGTSLWAVEELERGQVQPATGDPARLAAATGKSTEWFGQLFTAPSSETEQLAAPAPQTTTHGMRLVIAAIVALVVVRFFTEVFHLVPGAANFVDVPLFFVLLLAALAAPLPPTSLAPGVPIRAALLVFLFGVVCVVSVLANLDRVATGPVLLFVYGFLGPLGFYFAAYRLWPTGNARTMARLIVTLGLIQLAVILLVDAPRFVATGGNPDTISGTFGNNPYQLIFFLIMFVGLLAGAATFESGTKLARFAPFLIGASFVVMFLAQYRALLLSTLVALVALGLLLGVVRGRGMLVAVFTIAIFAVTLTYVAQRFPQMKFATTIASFKDDPGFFARARMDVFVDVADVYAHEPHTVAVGTGPGTYSSRAWRTFADLYSGETEVITPYIRAITGGAKYRTDVSEKYVIPQLRTGDIVLGSHAVTSPFSSYSTLLGEVGLLGFGALVVIYLGALMRGARMAVSAMRRAAPVDPLPGLLLAATLGLLMLLQMAFLENWFEAIRVTVPAWIVLAVATKEFEARRAREAEEGA